MTSRARGVLDEIAVAEVEPAPESAVFLRPLSLGGVEALHATFVRHRYVPHVHDDFTVAPVERGAVTFDLDDSRHLVPANHVSVIPPGKVHNGEPATSLGYTYKVLYLAPEQTTARLDADADRPPPRAPVVIHDPELSRRLAHTHAHLAAAPDELHHP